MKKSLQIFKRDLKRLSHNAVAMIVTIGVCLIPSLYAWFNIAANYDPYANTKSIQIAVANLDRGTTTDLTGELDAGGEIIDNLKENKDLGWVFTSRKKAIDGVKSGKYYAAIVIPEDFSSSLVSVLSGSMEQPKFEYYLNEKKNAIAPKITDTGASTIQEQVNESFVSAASGSVAKILGQTVSNLGSQVNQAEEHLTSKLNKVSANLSDYQSVLAQMNQTIDSSNDLIGGTQNTLAALKDAAASGSKALEDGNRALSSTRSDVRSLSSGLSLGLTQSANLLSNIGSAASTDLGKLNENIQHVNAGVSSAIQSVQDLIAKNEEMLSVLRELDNQIPNHPLSDLITQLEQENKRHQELLANLQLGNTSIGNAVNTSTNAFAQISAALQSGQSDLQNSKAAFETKVLPSLNQSLDSFSSVSGKLSGILTGVGPATDQLTVLTAELSTTLNHTKTALDGTKEALEQVQKKLDSAITDFGALQSSQTYQNLMSLTEKNADDIADFMYAPVTLKTETFYHVENYGSALAPFYTNLAIWVGGVVLIAIFKLEVDKDDTIRTFTASQGYFGRWLLYVSAGLIQALIVCLGDIFILKIQCKNPAAFIFAGLFASFVYVNLIYALSLTFKHIGKALSVILVILQIPGSAGTYPIEMTPAFFQVVHPLLPFTYGINAMREAVAGIYGFHYIKNLLFLAIFLPIAWCIGLALRPCILNLNCLFDRKLAETDLMICEEEGMLQEKISLSAVVRILSDQKGFQEKIQQRIQKFESGYAKKIRRGFLAILIIPVIFLILMFGISSKMVFLVLWILSIIAIAAYLIVIEYIHESLAKQKRLSELSEEALLGTLRQKRKEHLPDAPEKGGQKQ